MNSSKTVHVQARVDEKLKADAIDILNKLGISISEFIKLSLAQVVRDKSTQFELELLAEDKEEHYTEIKDLDHLKNLIGFSS